MARVYGRQYVIQWDGEAESFHVSLGREAIGAHKTRDGARALAAGHARQVSVFPAAEPLAVKFLD